MVPASSPIQSARTIQNEQKAANAYLKEQAKAESRYQQSIPDKMMRSGTYYPANPPPFYMTSNMMSN